MSAAGGRSWCRWGAPGVTMTSAGGGGARIVSTGWTRWMALRGGCIGQKGVERVGVVSGCGGDFERRSNSVCRGADSVAGLVVTFPPRSGDHHAPRGGSALGWHVLSPGPVRVADGLVTSNLRKLDQNACCAAPWVTPVSPPPDGSPRAGGCPWRRVVPERWGLSEPDVWRRHGRVDRSIRPPPGTLRRQNLRCCGRRSRSSPLTRGPSRR